MSQKQTNAEKMERIVSLCKRRGFVFQSSEIYAASTAHGIYGPLGVELKRNLKDYWWRVMVRERNDVVGMDGSILMIAPVWKASGHEETFTDPMVDCPHLQGPPPAPINCRKKMASPYCPTCGGRDSTESPRLQPHVHHLRRRDAG